MNTQVRSYSTDMALQAAWRDATPRSMQLPALLSLNRAPEMAFVSALWVVQGLLQVAALGIGMPAGLALVLITVAKDGVNGLIQAHISEKQP